MRRPKTFAALVCAILLLPLTIFFLDTMTKDDLSAAVRPISATENKFTLLNLNMYHELPAIRGTRNARTERLSRFIQSHQPIHAITLQEVTRSYIFGFPEKIINRISPGYHSVYTHVGGVLPILEMGQLTLSAFPAETQSRYHVRSTHFRSIGFQTMQTPLGKINLFNVHIWGTVEETKELADFVSAVADTGIVVLAGDFNFNSHGDGESALAILTQNGFTPAGTEEATSGLESIYDANSRHTKWDDAVFVSQVPPGMSVTQTQVFTEPENGVWISDHIGLLVTIEKKSTQ